MPMSMNPSSKIFQANIPSRLIEVLEPFIILKSLRVFKPLFMPKQCLWTLHPKVFEPSSQVRSTKLVKPSSSQGPHPKSFNKISSISSCQSLWALHPKLFEPFIIPSLLARTLSISSCQNLWTFHPKLFEPFSQNSLDPSSQVFSKRRWACLHAKVLEPFIPNSLNPSSQVF